MKQKLKAILFGHTSQLGIPSTIAHSWSSIAYIYRNCSYFMLYFESNFMNVDDPYCKDTYFYCCTMKFEIKVYNVFMIKLWAVYADNAWVCMQTQVTILYSTSQGVVLLIFWN